MATVMPFRGVRFNLQQVPDLSSVVSQPYDRIGPDLRTSYYALSPYNIVRIIQGIPLPTDLPERLEGPNVYSRAAAYYDLWRTEQVLVQEEQPALYVYHQTFTVDGKPKTRKAFIAALELSGFEEGVVLPHERTHSGPKLDRLRLLRALHVQTGQVFMLYPDLQDGVNAILDAAIASRNPILDGKELFENDVQQRLWVITDPAVIRAVQEKMTPERNMVIADGHHRYETALNYCREMRTNYPDAPVDAAFRYCMVSMVSMDDPGLVILPTHREVFGLPHASVSSLLSRVTPSFDVLPVPDMKACFAEMRAHERQHAFGFYAAGTFAVLILRDPALIQQQIPGDQSLAWKSLDVSILHKILLEGLLGFSEQVVDEQSHLRYHRDPSVALANVRAGEGNCVFFLNPTRIAEVKACAMHGDRMPQKSTDFYPKVISGLTMMPVSDQERL